MKFLLLAATGLSVTIWCKKKHLSVCLALVLIAIILEGCIIFPVVYQGEPTASSAYPTETSGRSQEEIEKLFVLLQSREGYHLGTNVELRGNIKVHMFFIDDQESGWDCDSVEEFRNKQIIPGLYYLEREASRYGVLLNFSVESHTMGTVTGRPLLYDGMIVDTVRDDDNGRNNDGVPKRIAWQLGYEDEGEMFAQLYQENDHQEVILLFIVNKDGVSYASKQIGGSEYNAWVEYSIIFRNHLSGDFGPDELMDRVASVAHEILHLYGAIDMYEPIERKELLETLYPNDIMLLDYLDFREMWVGEHTAYTVGWLDSPPTLQP